MSAALKRIERTSLSDDLADRVVDLIRSTPYAPGDRLPTIMEMARTFGVGHPTLREALKKLEVVGVVEIKHGSGVYVGHGQDALFVSNPVFGGDVSKKLLLDLVEARLPLEVRAAGLAAAHASPADLRRMKLTLERAAAQMEDGDALSAANMSFHRAIAEASGNAILPQLQDVLTQLFNREQRLILDIYGSRERDHAEHVAIFDALRAGDTVHAETRMCAHLEGVREVLLRWDPKDHAPFG